MNRYKLLKVPHIFDYANCSHAVKNDLNAAYKAHLILPLAPGFSGDCFELIIELDEKVNLGKSQTTITYFNSNDDVTVSRQLADQFWDKVAEFLVSKYGADAATIKLHLKVIRNSHW